ncbi:MAG: histidinol-phosphatase HisJ family protein [Candidatus Caldatribacterium sp.]|uniref:histidinol-phosphatase HisJ family protein n=1 Tax=Candidatus Caldatribacterium sp. TaxID=2282143 RepID=UPI002996B53F|nr:histidinol-phosphatase HisJ family protein [Candidatus Caldatribacterium sp.]MCX7730500.1 histidinol-phosphatase HisJ family protein [Candidatus Caldatribacterium sp.]MDW8080561.1 histidinol-phosphatase HisJ family protein [Candidatus Calescibacterium sp.]
MGVIAVLCCDYHMHTFRCGDASGTYEEYIEKALERGLREIGFSGHSPQYFLPKSMRRRESAIPEEELELYAKEVEALREKYRGSLAIRIGLEVDFVPGHDEELERIVSFYAWDYLLLSVHYLDGWPFDHPKYIGRYREWDINDLFAAYYRVLKRGIETGWFDAVAHLDLPKKFGFRPTREIPELEEVLFACAKYNVAVELNTAGWRGPAREAYPSLSILQRAQAVGLSVCVGSDAHHPENVGGHFLEAEELLRKAGFTTTLRFVQRQKIPVPFGENCS